MLIACTYLHSLFVHTLTSLASARAAVDPPEVVQTRDRFREGRNTRDERANDDIAA